MTPEETTLRKQIDELLDMGNLSRWETSLLISVGSQLDRGWGLTEKQTSMLKELIEKKL